MPRAKRISKEDRELAESVGTKEGQLNYLTKELIKATRSSDKLRILERIATMRGLNVAHEIGDLKMLSEEKLEELLQEVIWPVLQQSHGHALAEIVKEAISSGRWDARARRGRLQGGSEETEPSGRSVRARRQPPGKSGGVPPVDGPDKAPVRREPVGQIACSCPGDQVVAGGLTPVPEDAVAAEDVRHFGRLSDAV